MEYKLVSWNVNGLNSQKKKRSVYYWLEKQKRDIVYLQEVHIRNMDSKYLQNKQLGKEFASLAAVKKRGTVIYVKEALQPKEIFSDTDGRFVAVECVLKKKKI